MRLETSHHGRLDEGDFLTRGREKGGVRHFADKVLAVFDLCVQEVHAYYLDNATTLGTGIVGVVEPHPLRHAARTTYEG